MISFFDIYSLALLAASLSVFFLRYVRQNQPIVPYLVIACVCAVGNWLGNAGEGYSALSLLVAASFLFVGCVVAPYRSRLSQFLDRKQKSAIVTGDHDA